MTTNSLNQAQLEKMRSARGFIAALDQSGGSTPGALRLYGIKENAWSNESRNVRSRAPDAHANHHQPELSTARGFWEQSSSRTRWTGKLKDSQLATIFGT